MGITLRTAEDLFDNEASQWEARYHQPFFIDRLKILNAWIESLDSIYQHPVSVIDVGCGTFPSEKIFLKHNYHAVGVDVSTKMIEVAKGLGRSALHYNGVDLPFNSNSTNIITMFNVIEFVHEPEKLLSNIYRILRPGGCILLTIVNNCALQRKYIAWRKKIPKGENLYGKEWINSYTIGNIEPFLRSHGFSQVRVYAHSLPVMYENIFSRLPDLLLPFIRNSFFSDSAYISAVKK